MNTLANPQLDNKVKPALITGLANFIATFIKFGITLISIPLLVSYIGSEMYGLITTILTMCFWLNTIADGGLGLSLKNAIIRQRALNNDEEKITELISSAFFILLFFVVFICLFFSAIIPFLDWRSILNIHVQVSSSELISFILIMLWTSLLILPFGLTRLIYSAYQKEYLFSTWVLAGSLIGIFLLWFFIYNNEGFVLPSAALQLGGLIAFIMGTIYFIKNKSIPRFEIRTIKWLTFKKLLISSADFFILQIATLAIFQSGVFITNYFLGQQDAATYAVHFQLFSYFQTFILLFINPFWPVMGEAYHQKNKLEFKKVLFNLTLTVGLLSLGFATFMIGFGPHLIEFIGYHKIEYIPALIWLFAAYNLFSVPLSVFSIALLCVNDTKPMRKIVILQGGLNIIFSIIFIQLFGILGCALSSLMAILLTVFWYSPLRLKYILHAWSS